MFLEKRADAFVELAGHIPGPGNDLGPIVPDVVGVNAPGRGFVGKFVEEFRVGDQRLGGNAPPVKAGSAQPIALDAGDLHTELSGPNCRDISSGSAADNQEVVAE